MCSLLDEIFATLKQRFESSLALRALLGMSFISTLLVVLLVLPGSASWSFLPFVAFYSVSAGTFLFGLGYALSIVCE